MTIKIETGKNLQTLGNDIVINCGVPSQMASIEALIEIFDTVLNASPYQDSKITQLSIFTERTIQQKCSHFEDIEYQKIFEEGKECNILSPNFSKWQKGKLTAKLVIDFEPDLESTSDYESPLDEIRREIDQANNQQSGGLSDEQA